METLLDAIWSDEECTEERKEEVFTLQNTRAAMKINCMMICCINQDGIIGPCILSFGC